MLAITMIKLVRSVPFVIQTSTERHNKTHTPIVRIYTYILHIEAVSLILD